MDNSVSGQRNSIRQDPFVKGLMARLPEAERDSFSDNQLLALKVAMGARQWGRHIFDQRGTIGFWRWRYYYVFIGGRERRELSRRQKEMARQAQVIFLALFFTFSTLLGLLILYLIKSALGINLIPGFSLGIWGWFKGEFLN
ncbi:MAG: hypothetical protein OEY01_11535 [Desulfobulbaceae bacterium]|nr:hypothetical protein [Desulfobulbaceae bacterium]HIJ79483.1 3-phosphoshikimate 1-carboxyvinyltransferase [Deltaproteobacteria bacterium]